MDQEFKRRAGRNEALFRDTNEAIERGQWPDDPGKVVRFRCECSRLDCGEPVEMTLNDYEQLRAFPRRFVLAVGHEMSEIETVIASNDEYVLVEKFDAAGQVAAATDPRS